MTTRYLYKALICRIFYPLRGCVAKTMNPPILVSLCSAPNVCLQVLSRGDERGSSRYILTIVFASKPSVG